MARKSKREILVESFQALALTTPVNKITITHITDNCGLSQPTFYRYFKDKYDLMAWSYITDVQKVMVKIGMDGYMWRDALYEFTRSLAENHVLVLNALKHTSGRDAFLHQMEEINIELLCAEIRKVIMTEQIPDDILNVVRIYCYGTARLNCNWLMDNMPFPPERLAEIMEKALPESLKVYLYP